MRLVKENDALTSLFSETTCGSNRGPVKRSRIACSAWSMVVCLQVRAQHNKTMLPSWYLHKKHEYSATLLQKRACYVSKTNFISWVRRERKKFCQSPKWRVTSLKLQAFKSTGPILFGWPAIPPRSEELMNGSHLTIARSQHIYLQGKRASSSIALLCKTFFVSLIFVLGMRNLACGREKITLCSDFKVPGSNLVCGTFCYAFSLFFSFKTAWNYASGGTRMLTKKKSP